MPNEAPQYGGPQVRTAPLPTPRLDPDIVTPDAYGASAVEGAGAAAFALNKAQDDAQQQRDQTLAMDARLRYLKDRNPDLAGYMQRQKGDAIGLPREAEIDHNRRRDEILQTLPTEGSKDMFRQMMVRQQVTEDSVIQQHAATQVKAFEIDTAESTIAQLHEQAITLGTPEAIDEALRLTMGTRNKLADLRGEDAQTLENHHQADRSTIYSGIVMDKLSTGDFTGAAEFYDAHKDQMDSTARHVLETDTREGKLATQAQQTADVVMRTMAVDRTKAFAQVDAIEDPKLRERTRVNVQRAFADRDASKKELQGSSFESLAKQVEGGASLDTLAAKDPNAWNALDEQDRAALRHVQDDTIKRQEPPALSDHYYQLRNLAGELPGEFIAHDFRRDRGLIPERERGQLMEVQADMKAHANSKTGATTPRGFMSVDAVAKDTLRSIGIEPNEVKGVMDPRAIQFTRALDKAVEAAGGHEKVTNDQVRAMADKLLIEQPVPDPAGMAGKTLRAVTFGAAGWLGFGVDGTKQVRTFEMPNADRMAFNPSQMPQDGRTKARDALIRKGISDPTEAQILDTYNRAIGAQAPQ